MDIEHKTRFTTNEDAHVVWDMLSTLKNLGFCKVISYNLGEALEGDFKTIIVWT